MRRIWRAWIPFLALAGVLASRSVSAGSDAEALPQYHRQPGITGNIKSVGSDTMNNLMTLWAEGFRRYYPGVRIEIEGKGSSSAPPALIARSASFGPMSREMKEQEVDAFVRRFGYRPTQLVVGIDLLAVYVHKDNPIPGLTLAQVDAIFGKFRRLNYPSEIGRWGELGLEGPFIRQPISVFGRNAASGTYGYLKEKVLRGGDFKDSVQEQPGSSSVIQGVANDLYGIGYSGIGYKTADVRAVPLAANAKSPFVPALPERALKGDYPLARPLLLCLNHEPGKPLEALQREFVRYVLSRPGQTEVIKDGYLPITADIARDMLNAVELPLATAAAGPRP